ncbi:MAG: hypothetical protein H7263_08300 [Candidatus Sericytochromatia bacterium]|nr:hypothetical protein [Candidatus Sericytochromatia bacterium]
MIHNEKIKNMNFELKKIKRKYIFITLFVTLSILFVIIHKEKKAYESTFNTSTLGKIVGFKANNRDHIDAIILLTKSGAIPLGFPPNEAHTVLNVAKKGDQVIALFNTKNQHTNDRDKKTDYRLLKISNLKTHSSVDLTEKIPPPFDLGKDIDIEVDLNKLKFHFDNKNRAKGLIYNNYFIDIKPELMEQIKPFIDKAKTITIKGKQSIEDSNFVNYYGYLTVKPDLITIDNRSYLLK